MRTLKIFTAFLSLLLLLSCSKEYSNESGGGLGLSCKLSNITAIDDQTGQGVYALNTRYDNTGRSNYVQLYDSVLASVDYDIDLEYRTSDTIRTSTGDILVIDGSKRLKKLLTPLDPNDPDGEQLIYEYKYNGNGYLTEKALSTSTIPLTLFQTIYTWSGGNLTKVESSSNLTGTKQKLLDVNLEYDLTKSPKNFIPLYPEAFESFLYVTSVDMGKPSLNLLARVSAVYYDDQGNPSPPVVTEITEAKFSNDGYLTEWYVSGSSFDALGLFIGRNTFTYKCN
jgi:YD repeat-containing protein